MDNQISTTKIAAFGLRAQADRLRHVSENIANADTPGYRARDMKACDTTDGRRNRSVTRPS